MNGEVTDYVAGLWLKAFTPCWWSLHTADPGHDGSVQSELIGGSYARQSAAFTTVDARTIWLATKLTWPGLPAARVTHVGVWDALYNGHLLTFAALPAPGKDVAQGGAITLDPHTYAISIGLPV